MPLAKNYIIWLSIFANLYCQHYEYKPANKKSSPQEDLTEENLQGEGE